MAATPPSFSNAPVGTLTFNSPVNQQPFATTTITDGDVPTYKLFTVRFTDLNTGNGLRIDTNTLPATIQALNADDEPIGNGASELKLVVDAGATVDTATLQGLVQSIVVYTDTKGCSTREIEFELVDTNDVSSGLQQFSFDIAGAPNACGSTIDTGFNLFGDVASTPTLVLPDITLYDNNTNLAQVTLALPTGGIYYNSDVFSLDLDPAQTDLDVTGSIVPGDDDQRTITITPSNGAPSAPLSVFQAALRLFKWSSTADGEVGSRTLILTFEDEMGDSGSTPMLLRKVYRPESATTQSSVLVQVVTDSGNNIQPQITVNDRDGGSITKVVIQVEGGTDGDVFGSRGWTPFSPTMTVISTAGVPQSIEITGTGSPTNYQEYLRTIVMDTTKRGDGTRTFKFQLTDTDEFTSTELTTTAVVDVVPVVSVPLPTGSYRYVEPDGSDQLVVDTLTISDEDSTKLKKARIIQWGPWPTAADSVTIDHTSVDGTNIVITDWDPNNKVLTLEGEDTLAVKISATETGNRNYMVVVNDKEGGQSAGVALNVKVAAKPQISAPIQTIISSGQTTPAFPTLAITDADSANLNKVTIEITSGYVAEDLMTVSIPPTPPNTPPAFIAGQSGAVLTITGYSSPADFADVVNTLQFQDGATGTRQLTITATDNDGLASDAKVVNVKINAVPEISVHDTYVAHTIGGDATPVLKTVTLSDADNQKLAEAKVTLLREDLLDEMRWDADCSANLNVAYDNNSGTLTFSSPTYDNLVDDGATYYDFENCLNKVSVAIPSTTTQKTRRVQVDVSDGAISTQKIVNVVPLEAPDMPASLPSDPPSVSQPPVYVDKGAAILVYVLESAVIPDTFGAPVFAKIRITYGYTQGEDTLTHADPITNPDIQANVDLTEGSFTIAGPGTKAEYEAILKKIQYQTMTNNPTATRKTFSFQVSDGTNLWSSPTYKLMIGNEAPVVFANVPNSHTDAGSAFSLQLNPAQLFTDVDSDPLSYTPTLPSWLSFDPSVNLLTGTTPNEAGQHDVSFTAWDGVGSIISSFKVEINAPTPTDSTPVPSATPTSTDLAGSPGGNKLGEASSTKQAGTIAGSVIGSCAGVALLGIGAFMFKKKGWKASKRAVRDAGDV